jgi:hypothetical protein
MNIRDFDPALGQAFQGDIAIVPMPVGIRIATVDEIRPGEDGRLIIQEGEASGHHHAIELPAARNFRPAVERGDPVSHTRDRKLHKAFGGRAVGTAKLYRDAAAVEALRGAGVLTRSNLAIGCLVVEGAPVVIRHEEHDGIRVPPGNYYLGRQVESAGAEERVVAD